MGKDALQIVIISGAGLLVWRCHFSLTVLSGMIACLAMSRVLSGLLDW
jgi:hypothetical protein